MSERIVTNKDKRRSLDVWNTVPWLAAHRIGGRHHRMIVSAEQAQHQDATPQEAAPDAGVVPAEDRVRAVPPTD